MQRCKSESQVVNIYYAQCTILKIALKMIHCINFLILLRKSSFAFMSLHLFFKFLYKVDTFKARVFSFNYTFLNFMCVLLWSKSTTLMSNWQCTVYLQLHRPCCNGLDFSRFSHSITSPCLPLQTSPPPPSPSYQIDGHRQNKYLLEIFVRNLDLLALL